MLQGLTLHPLTCDVLGEWEDQWKVKVQQDPRLWDIVMKSFANQARRQALSISIHAVEPSHAASATPLVL